MNKNIEKAQKNLALVIQPGTLKHITAADVPIMLLANTQALIGLAELQQTANEIAIAQLSVQLDAIGAVPGSPGRATFRHLDRQVAQQ